MTEEEIRQKHLNTYCTYNIDINYFRKIDSHAKAQVLGMMYADSLQ